MAVRADPDGAGPNPRHQQSTPTRSATPNGTTTRADAPIWHQLLRHTVEFSKNRRASPLALAGSVPEARFQSTRVPGRLLRGLPRSCRPELYQSFRPVLPFLRIGLTFLDSTRVSGPPGRTIAFRPGVPPLYRAFQGDFAALNAASITSGPAARPWGRRSASRSCWGWLPPGPASESSSVSVPPWRATSRTLRDLGPAVNSPARGASGCG